jgi:hypothetical protein
MKTLPLIAIAALLCCSCAVTKTLSYSDRIIRQGTGGSFETRDGIELWWNGAPNRRYMVIGCLVQDRLSLIGDAMLVQRAKALGGDALLRGSRESYQAGSYTSGFATISGYSDFATVTGSSFTVPIVRGEYQYYVIKYLP